MPALKYNANYTVMKVAANSYAQTSADLGINLNGSQAFSVDAWVRLNGLCSEDSILSKEGVFNFGLEGNQVVFAIAGYAPVHSDPKIQALDDEIWHYVCATFDGGNVRLFVDGEFNVVAGISGAGNSNANPFLMGDNLQAFVKNVRVYNTAVSADDVKKNMFNAPATASIVTDFDFSQNPPIDKGSGNLPISLENGAAMVTKYPGVHLSDTAYTQPLRDKSINPGGYQVDPYSIQAWIYVDEKNHYQTIFINSDLESDSGIELYLQHDDVNEQGYFLKVLRGSYDVAENIQTASSKIQANTWVNVAVTFDGLTQIIYIEGEVKAHANFNPITNILQESNLLIGASISQGSPSGSSTFRGYISRVDVWDRALNAAEVLKYASELPDTAAPGVQAIYNFMSAPARNLVNGHPIGLVDGADLDYQISNSLVNVSPPAETNLGLEKIDEKYLQELRGSVDFSSLIEEHGNLFKKALKADLTSPLVKKYIKEKDFPEYKEKLEKAWKDVGQKLREDPWSLPFLVTQHEIKGEHVLICHSKGRSHVAFRAKVGSIEPCTLWEIKLVFIVVAGLLDAIFGISSNMTDKAISLIARVLAMSARIKVMLAMGAGITATLLFEILSGLYRQGVLKELVLLIIDVGFWTILRIAAKIVLTIAGVGYADTIASLVATVATFILAYTQRPASCNPLPKANIAAIKFNHDTTAFSSDAMSIRKNYTEKVEIPEWMSGETTAEQSPAAYSIKETAGKTITIKTKFVLDASVDTSAQIQATGGGLLGAIDPITVNFKHGVSTPEFISIPLNHQSINALGVNKEDIQWDWQYKLSGGAWTNIGSTKHRIYIILQIPTAPWELTGFSTNTQNPWTDVLDYACEWAKGETSPDDAAKEITTKINGTINLTYDMNHGASVYTSMLSGTSFFLCTDFHAFLNSGAGKGRTVNCTDCATITTTFANILGCDLFASTISWGVGFDFNQIIAIGHTTWGCPNWGCSFSYHEVAWTGTGSYVDPLYDACLKANNSDNPWATPSTSTPSVLPTKMLFTTLAPSPTLPIATPFTGQSYRERLCTNNAAGIEKCDPTATRAYTSGGRRKVM